jgi:hypothetical protein
MTGKYEDGNYIMWLVEQTSDMVPGVMYDVIPENSGQDS